MDKRIIDDITNYIFVSDKPQKVDIVFLPGSSSPETPEFAADLYKEGYANKFLPSGGVSVKSGRFNGVKSKSDIYDQEYKTDCEFYTDVLIKNGVPKSIIYCEDKSGFTKENAFFSRKIVEKFNLNIKKAMICCKSFHARRCLMFYQLAFPNTEMYVMPVDCYGITRENWYLHDYGIERVLGELSRCGNQFVEDMKNCKKINS